MSILGNININQERFNSPTKRSFRGSPDKQQVAAMLPSEGLGDNDGFSFKLSQVPKKSEAPPSFDQSLADFDKFVQDQRVLLPQKISQAKSAEER